MKKEVFLSGFPFEFSIAFILTLCLVAFFSVTIWSIWKARSTRNKSTEGAEQPSIEESVKTDFLFSLAIIGTLAFAVMILLYLFLAYTNNLGVLQFLSFESLIPFGSVLKLIGSLLLVFGFLFFSWSIIVRTRAAGSSKLVTWGPFRYVRHPSYFSYFLLFIGLFLLWPNALTAISLIGIPGYFGVTSQEEEFLVNQFGAKYGEYQERTGCLFPKLRRKSRGQSKH